MEEQMINNEETVTEQTEMPEEEYGYSGDPFEGMGQELCKRCGTRYIDYSQNPQSILCKECREEMLKLNIPKPVIVFSILVAILTVVNIGIFASEFVKFKNADGFEYATHMTDERCKLYQDMADDGNVVTALDSMVEILETEPENLEMAITLADVAMEYTYPDYAAWAIDNYLAGQEVSDKEVDRMNGYIDELNVYYATDELTTAIYDEMYKNMGSTEEEYVAAIQNCHDRIAAYIGDNTYDQALLEYQISFLCSDSDEWVSHLENCISINDDYYDAHAQLAVYYRRNGDLDKAREIISAVYEKNKEDYALLRAYATLELTEGNLDEALSYAQKAYEMYPEGEYVADTYIIALAANGQQEEAETLTQELENAGYYFDDEFYAILNGELTLEEYYIGE